MLSNNEIAVFCEQSGMILESGLSMLEGISIMEPVLKKQAFFMKHYKGQEFSRIT